ncbi:MAG: hypothetical protein HC932_03795 [Thermales bacterium]|nr:hypothetical protein [Thermales bacterium]
MSAKRVVINGFGRIGRLTCRSILTKYPEIEIIAINDLGNPQNLAYLFEFDSTYGRWDGQVEAGDDFIKIDGKKIKILSQKDPSSLPWAELGIDIVIESTGLFRSSELATKHTQAGAKKVVISAPPKSDDITTTVIGSNQLDQSSRLISCASCTTNAIATVLGPINKNFKIQKVIGVTVHAYTASQVLQDTTNDKGFRDGRAAAVNIIPTTTGAAKSVVDIFQILRAK